MIKNLINSKLYIDGGGGELVSIDSFANLRIYIYMKESCDPMRRVIQVCAHHVALGWRANLNDVLR